MIHRKSSELPIGDNEEILCRFERIVDGKFQTYLSVGPYTHSEMLKVLKGLIALSEDHAKENSTDESL